MTQKSRNGGRRPQITLSGENQEALLLIMEHLKREMGSLASSHARYFQEWSGFPAMGAEQGNGTHGARFLKRPSHSLSELERYDAIAQRFLSLSTG